MKYLLIVMVAMMLFVGCSSKTTELKKSPCACLEQNQKLS
jgi:uncharacterized protein YcfL